VSTPLADYWPEDPMPVELPPTTDRESAEYWRWVSAALLRKRLIELDVLAGEAP
jgi:hypothetical protein